MRFWRDQNFADIIPFTENVKHLIISSSRSFRYLFQKPSFSRRYFPPPKLPIPENELTVTKTAYLDRIQIQNCKGS